MTATTSAAHQKLLIESGAPVQSSQIEEWIQWLFTWSPEITAKHLELVAERLAEIDRFEKMFLPKLVRDDLIASLRTIGIPCNPDIHEQPHQFLNLFPTPCASTSLDEFITDPDDDERPMEVLTPILLPLWGIKCREYAERHKADLELPEDVLLDTLNDLTDLGHRLLIFLWPRASVIESQLWLLRYYTQYFKFTRGCIDLESGDLLNRVLPARREYIYKYGDTK